MNIKISFKIDDHMALLAIESLLSKKEKVSKAAIISLCKKHLRAEGELFDNEPTFDLGDNDVNPQEAAKAYKEIWLKK